jgi:hypothetical protein
MGEKKMKVVIHYGLILIASVLASCGPKSSMSHGPQTQTPNPSEVTTDTHQKVTPNGSFQATGEVQKEIDARFQLGCAKPGEPLVSEEFHPGLKAGDKFVLKTLSSESSGFNATTTSIVKNVSPKELRVEFETLFNEGNKLAGAMTCKIGDEASQGAPVCETTPIAPEAQAVPAAPAKEETAAQNCRIEYAEGAQTKTVVEGEYTFSSGLKVKAYQVTEKFGGQIKCLSADGSEVDRGAGEEVSSEIVSNEIVSDTPMYCGGTKILSSQSLTDREGKVLVSKGAELLEAPRFEK